MTFLWVYAYNLRYPMMGFCGLGIALCLAIGLWSLGVKNKTAFASPENGDARWRTLTAAQSGVVLALVAALIWAVPAPNYAERIVYRDRTVEKKVPYIKFTATKTIFKQAAYKEVFDDCMDHVEDSAETNAQCHQQALVASRPVPEPPKVVVRRFISHDTYSQLFKQCNAFNMDDAFTKDPIRAAELRNDRLKTCSEAALKASTPRQYLH
jgi:hypothetical protein